LVGTSPKSSVKSSPPTAKAADVAHPVDESRDASLPAFAVVACIVDGKKNGEILTLYLPGRKFSNKYRPVASVWANMNSCPDRSKTGFPSSSTNSIQICPTGVSPAVCNPSEFSSYHT
jgi:hypothetical protein